MDTCRGVYKNSWPKAPRPKINFLLGDFLMARNHQNMQNIRVFQNNSHEESPAAAPWRTFLLERNETQNK